MPTRRKIIQLYAALLYNAQLKGFVTGDIYTGPLKNLCVPGLNCYSCPGAIGACPLGALQNALAASGTRAPWYVLGILLLFGLTFGRTVCGWLCPMGLIQELLYKTPTKKMKKSPVTRALSYLKYIILLLFVLYIPLSYAAKRIPVPGFCKYICPAGTLEGAIALMLNPNSARKLPTPGILFISKLLILVLLLSGCIFIYRIFCRFLCPLGAIYGLFSKLSLLGVRVDAGHCVNCGRCTMHCKMDVLRVGDHECIQCGECTQVCHKDAIHWYLGNKCLSLGKEFSLDKACAEAVADCMTSNSMIPAVPNRQSIRNRNHNPRRFTCRLFAIAMLITVMFCVNKPFNKDKSSVAHSKDSAAEADSAVESRPDTLLGASQDTAGQDPAQGDANAETGPEVGMKCPGFQVPLYSGTSGEYVSLSDYRDKPVVINLWATWCGSCIKELPDFEKLWIKYQDQIGMIAIDTDPGSGDAKSYISRQGFTMPMGYDDGRIAYALGNIRILPQTVILDRSGRIVYNKADSVTLEELETLIKPLIDTVSAEDHKPDSASPIAESGESSVSVYNNAPSTMNHTAGILNQPDGESSLPSPNNNTTVSHSDYLLKVTDENGTGIENVKLQVCDDTTCRLYTTDTDGTASFDLPPYAWEIHVLAVPDGYEKPADTFLLNPKGGELSIALASAPTAHSTSGN
ncbi:MAG: redoxin domain-containing protein [Blautia sp.]|nr:redoxin domain-containing protein [Blautia sp.]